MQKKQIDIIKEECQKIGITHTELFRESGVPHSTIQNWERDDPKPFKTLNKLNETLERLKAAKTENPKTESAPAEVIE